MLWRIGLMLVVALPLLLFPALLAGVLIGGVVGRLWPRAQRGDREALKERRGIGWTLLAAGAVIALICTALFVAGPLAVEIDRFLAAWHPPGATLIDPTTLIDLSALTRFPWGWIPIAAAIALATAGTSIVLRNRR